MAAIALLWIGLADAYASNGTTSAAQMEAAIAAQQAEGSSSELPWLFAVFIVTWAAFFAYIFYLSHKQREMRREIDALRRALADRERRDTQSEASPGAHNRQASPGNS